MVICPNCGRNTPKGTFCEHCGARIDGPGPGGAKSRMLLIGIVIVFAILAIAAFIVFQPGMAGQQQVQGKVPAQVTGQVQQPAQGTLAAQQTTAASPLTAAVPPTLIITSAGKRGSMDAVKGQVTGTTPGSHSVVVYIYVGKWYGPKPLWEKPLTPIAADGSWSCSIGTAATDADATRVAAYVVPAGVVPEQVDGVAELPAGMAQYPYRVVER
ncbi:MAG: hypothetical protein GYA23_06430 [Methanomicrobiales archaeon]|nr:hypothetical protein [Methanomicrobiales archaeon]